MGISLDVKVSGRGTQGWSTQMDPAPGMKIKVTKDGPYIASGGIPLSVEAIGSDDEGESVGWEHGADLEKRETCGLCRCGQSGTKPYCDGSHATVGFDGTETASFEPYVESCDVLVGPRVDVRDQKELCADARFCHRAGAVWHRVNDDDDEATDVVIEESKLCPSGRYTAVDKATGFAHEPEFEPSMALVQDPEMGVSGPLWVRGGIQVLSADGRSYEVRNRVTLCRCGHSSNKPFCDGSHIEGAFHDHL
jgi:CDGSH-type Zn-finger protein